MKADERGNVQLKADIPVDLRHRFHIALAIRDTKFAAWLKQQVAAWTAEVESQHQPGAANSANRSFTSMRS
jgi:hypothetical protein